jgi:hypothetical protein
VSPVVDGHDHAAPSSARGDESYDAFVSYSHATDGSLAPALQAGLQSIGKPWQLTGHTKSVTAVAFTPDGTTVVTASDRFGPVITVAIVVASVLPGVVAAVRGFPLDDAALAAISLALAAVREGLPAVLTIARAVARTTAVTGPCCCRRGTCSLGPRELAWAAGAALLILPVPWIEERWRVARR